MTTQKNKIIYFLEHLAKRFFLCLFMQLQWFLSLGDNFIVALEDASLIQLNTVLSGTNITVQGRRKEVMNPVKVNLYNAECCHLVLHFNNATNVNFATLLMQVWGNEGEFLALKLISGQYAYSMEAICPIGNLCL